VLTGQPRDGTEPTRVAIAGTGNIAAAHARALGSVGAATIVAAADVDEGRLAAFRDEFAVPAGYRDLGALLVAERPDLVHVCTPPGTHGELALACLRAGASVLVEKPPATSLREFDEIAAAEGAGGAGGAGPPWFATIFQHRFGAGQRRLKALAGAGEFGRPLVAVCNTAWFRDQAYFDVAWRGRWDTEGGGPTMGHGIHQMDMLLDVLGDWTEVSAVARRQARRMETEDLSLAQVTFASGAVASVLNSVLSPREESYLRFDFERATVEVTHLYGYRDDDWRITAAPGCEAVLARGDDPPEPPAHGGLRAPHTPAGGLRAPHTPRSGHAGQFREVLAALRAGRRPPVSPAESRRTLSLAAAIYASASTRQPVTPDDLAPGTPFYDRMNGGKQAW
jgi:predicted dehydrogenase